MFGQPQNSLFGVTSQPTTGLFNQPATPTGGAAGGLFGAQPAAGGGLFGAQPTAAPATGGGLFGAQPAAAPTTGLFGAQPAAPATNGAFSFSSTTPSTGTAFGQPTPTNNMFGAQPTAGNLFGSPSTQQPAAGNLFGAPAAQQPAATGLFGAPSAQQPATGNIFGATSQQPAATNLFGASTTQQPAAGGLFGSTTTQQPGIGGGMFGGTQPAATGGGLFGSPLPGTSTFSPGSVFGGPSSGGKTYSIQELSLNSDIAVTDVPKDTVASLVWSPTMLTMFATTSWDGLVRVYDTQATGTVIMKAQQNAPKAMLSAAWSEDGARLFFGGIDNKCYLWNLQSNQVIPVGGHNDIIQRVFVTPGQAVFGTVSADHTVKYWDLRAGSTPTAAAASVDLGFNPSGFDARGIQLVVSNFAPPSGTTGFGTSTGGGTTVFGYDLRNPQQPAMRQNSVLKLQTCALSLFSDLSGFAIASVEARCSLQYWNEDPDRQTTQQHRWFAFRCHRVNTVKAYSVNDIHFHPKSPDIFSTVGGDGVICFWDKQARHRLRLFKTLPLPVTQGKFNLDGSLFAYAAGYDWAEGADAAYNKGGVGIFVHKVTADEVVYSGAKKTDTYKRY